MTALPTGPGRQASAPAPGRAEPGPTATAPADQDADGDVLPCGAWIPALVDQVDAGQLEPAGTHQRSCAYCLAALRDAATSSQALDLLRAERGPVPAGLVDRVLRTVRQKRAASAPLILTSPGSWQVAGGIRVQLQVLADIARVAASRPGVTVARSSARTDDTAPGPGLRVALGLLVDGRAPLPVLGASVRRAVRRALHRATGMRDIHVDLAVLDLVVPDETGLGLAAPQRPPR